MNLTPATASSIMSKKGVRGRGGGAHCCACHESLLPDIHLTFRNCSQDTRLGSFILSAMVRVSCPVCILMKASYVALGAFYKEGTRQKGTRSDRRGQRQRRRRRWERRTSAKTTHIYDNYKQSTPSSSGLFAGQVKPHASGRVGSGQLTRPDPRKK